MKTQMTNQLTLATIFCISFLLSQTTCAESNKRTLVTQSVNENLIIKRKEGKVKIISPAPGTELIITAEPKMPKLKAEATVEFSNEEYQDSRSNIPPFAWRHVIRHIPIPGRLEFFTFPNEFETEEPTYATDFNLLRSIKKNNYNQYEDGGFIEGNVMGGELILTVEFYKHTRDQQAYTIKGTNPGKDAIEQILTDTVSRQIACQESRYKQFDAKREGGIGLPLIGRNKANMQVGGVGIMQLYNPKPTVEQVWNWRKNLEEGIERINKARKSAENAHIKEQIRLNAERVENGLPNCPDDIPTKLTPDQILRETIRRYNCGVEYRWEPRDDPDCKGNWVQYQSCGADDGADVNYVENVLACKI